MCDKDNCSHFNAVDKFRLPYKMLLKYINNY